MIEIGYAAWIGFVLYATMSDEKDPPVFKAFSFAALVAGPVFFRCIWESEEDAWERKGKEKTALVQPYVPGSSTCDVERRAGSRR